MMLVLVVCGIVAGATFFGAAVDGNAEMVAYRFR
jgi:hypothetical protein